MKIYPGTSYWDAYALPIPVRKWLIEEHVRQEQATNQPSVNTPLSTEQKRAFTNQVQPSVRTTTRK